MRCRGYNATGVKDITDAAGIPKGSFYNYFESKEEFAVEALRMYHNEYAAPYSDVLRDQSLDPLERIRRFVTMRIDAVIHQMCYREGCFVNTLCQEMADSSEAIAAAVNESIHDLNSALADCLKAAQDEKAISQEHNIGELAEFIDNSWRGVITTAKARRTPQPLEGFRKYLFSRILV